MKRIIGMGLWAFRADTMIKMKNILYMILLLVMAASCKNEVEDLTFGERPEIRMKAKIDSLSSVLKDAENGWKVVLGTGLGGGYSFYMDFDDQQVVKMLADLTAASPTTLQESNYRVKQDNGATLIFDTYNYISLLDDPSSSAYGGTTRDGYKSDLEWGFEYSKDDTLQFVGKRYRQMMVMIKATAEERQSYLSGGLKTTIDKTKQFFADNANPYIDISNDGGYKMGISLNFTTKFIELASLLPDGITSSSKGKFAHILTGMSIIDGGLWYRDLNFVEVKWEGDKLYLLDDKNKKYEIKNSVSPILPLYKLMGSKYTGLRSPYKTYFPGTSAKGLAILQRFQNGLASGTGYSFNSGYLEIYWNVPNSRLELRGFSSQNGGTSGWVTTIVYDYTVDEMGTYSCKLRTAASGGYVSAIMDQMDTFLKKNKFKLDYFVDGSTLYGQITSIDDPTIQMTFNLQ